MSSQFLQNTQTDLHILVPPKQMDSTHKNTNSMTDISHIITHWDWPKPDLLNFQRVKRTWLKDFWLWLLHLAPPIFIKLSPWLTAHLYVATLQGQPKPGLLVLHKVEGYLGVAFLLQVGDDWLAHQFGIPHHVQNLESIELQYVQLISYISNVFQIGLSIWPSVEP